MRALLFLSLLSSPAVLADPLTAPSTLPGGSVAVPAVATPAAPMHPAPAIHSLAAPAQTQRRAVPMQSGAVDRCSLRPDTTPHIAKLKDQDTPAVVFQSQADLYGASIAQVQSPADHLSPGSAFELDGACFGNETGSVDIRWTAAPERTDSVFTARLATIARSYTAEIVEWRDSKIVARLPADISGLAPGTLNLGVRPANSAAVSNTVATTFWPVWHNAHNADQARLFVQILYCEPASDRVRSACRGGSQSDQPEADFDYPAQGEAAFNTVAASHACRASQGCNMNSTDRYRIEVPAWVIPVITFWRDGNSHRKGGDSLPRVSLLPENSNSPLGKPRAYLLNINWSLVKNQEILAYRMDIGTLMPRGLEPAAAPLRERSVIPQGLPAGARVRMKDTQR